MATGGKIMWKPKSHEHRRSGVKVDGSLTHEQWEDFENALQELGDDFGLDITPIGGPGTKTVKRKAKKKTKKKSVKRRAPARKAKKAAKKK